MAPRILRFKKFIIIASIAALSLAGAGAAFAYWTSTGTGTGAAQTGSPELFTITSEPADGPVLTPGGVSGQTVAFTVTNPGPGAMSLGSVTVAVATGPGLSGVWAPVGGCSSADYTVSISDQPTPPIDLAADASWMGQATIVMNDLAHDQNGCKGLAVPLFFTASSDVAN